MKNFPDPTPTDVGLRAQMAYLALKKPLDLTRMAIGSGKPTNAADITQMTELVDEKKSFAITSLVLDDVSPNITASGVVDCMEVESPFECSELGLFIIDPITDKEVLYSYTYVEKSELVPAKIFASEQYNIETLISRTTGISISDQNKIPYVLRNEFERLKSITTRTVISETDPQETYPNMLWLKPVGSKSIESVIGSVAHINLEAYVGDNPPEDGNKFWLKPVAE